MKFLWLIGVLLVSYGYTAPLHAATGGSISGTVFDQSGAVLPECTLRLVGMAQHTSFQIVTSKLGIFVFPNVPVGQYDLTAVANGFAAWRSSGIAVDADASIRLDITLHVSSRNDTVVVQSNAAGVQVETSAMSLGGVVSDREMTSLPLNGRGYTDLLSLQPGVAPASTLLPSSVIMAGVTGSIDPSGDENPGNLSINGQRESSNGFLVNGVDVQEHMNGGTSILPNLNSIDEFRVLTTNFDPEYGNYDGGFVTVVTKAGGGTLHGSAFEFFRNTALDARGYFDPTRPAFNQNQFGGTGGGPLRRDKLFFFADYQATRTTQGVSTGNISVPTQNQRNGVFDDLTGSVSGPYLASLLSQELGYTVTAGEPYTSVFPGGTIPSRAWSAPAVHLLGYIPAPNLNAAQFSTSAFSQTVRDDKGSFRLDGNTRLGQLSAYYFADDYDLDNPYPGTVAGASIPGFDALFLGRAQLAALGATTVLNANTVNELHFGFLRNSNIAGQPSGGLGVSLAAQGFSQSTGSTPGIYVQAPQFEGVENITFPTFVMGVPITNLTQVNNTWFVSDGLSRVFGKHTVKAGGQFHADQVNEHPNATFNGTYNIEGTETGDSYADFLVGVASNFTQSSGQPFYLRNRYTGFYVQDSWRARRDLTINAGLRWDLITPWWEKYNQLQTYVPGAHSLLYPGAPTGLVVAGDPGIPRTLAPADHKSFAPRIALAYAPDLRGNGWLEKLFGHSGDSSIRVSYGIFYTAFQGLTAGIMYAVPPFGYNYLSPAPPLLATPFVTAASGVDNGQRFPFPFPSHSTSQMNPDTSVNWSNFLPLSADPFFYYRNRPAYTSSYLLSVQRQLSKRALLTVSYTGNQGHRIAALVSANPGDPKLCLSLAPACGPFGEDATYTDGSGQVIPGTRVGQGPDYGENTADSSVENSNYNALQTTVRYHSGGSQFLLSYSFAKSIDEGSNLGEQLDPLDSRHTRAISAWDIKHDFVVSYTVTLPFTHFFHKANGLAQGWSLSGTTRFASGFPVTLTDTSDKSLLGTLGNGANNYLLDTPQYSPGPLHIDRDGRSGQAEFNTSLFPEELEGQLGNAKRRMFYGPGIDNYDASIRKSIPLPEGKSLEGRLESFNVFNHAQFFGPNSVNGQEEDPNFGHIQSATAGRLLQASVTFIY